MGKVTDHKGGKGKGPRGKGGKQAGKKGGAVVSRFVRAGKRGKKMREKTSKLTSVVNEEIDAIRSSLFQDKGLTTTKGSEPRSMSLSRSVSMKGMGEVVSTDSLQTALEQSLGLTQ